MSSKSISEVLTESKSLSLKDLCDEICVCLKKNDITILEKSADEIIISSSNTTKKDVKDKIYSNLDILAKVPQYILKLILSFTEVDNKIYIRINFK